MRASGEAVFPLLIEPGKMALLGLKAQTDWESIVRYRQQAAPGDDHSHETVLGVHLDALGATGVPLRGDMDILTIELQDTHFGGYKLAQRTTSLTVPSYFSRHGR